MSPVLVSFCTAGWDDERSYRFVMLKSLYMHLYFIVSVMV